EHFDRGHMSLEDIIVRLGQLICRWAISQEPPYALHIGVHSGIVRKLVLRSGGEAVYGEAVSEAKRLADLAPQDSCVQILKSTKDKLNVLERLPFTCSRVNDCYYLEPSAELPEEAPPSAGYESLSPTSGGKHCTAEFRQMLVDHGIDISKFGKGQAKTLDELYRNVEVEKKSYFVKKNDSLERRMELVNISLTVTGQDGHDMELRLNCEVLKDSTLVRRNQRPSSFIEEGSGWKSAVDAFFASRLGLPAEIRQELLAQDNVVTDKVERIKSMFFPGVETMYTTYDVCIHIPDPTRPSLRAIGLPDMTSFDTEAIPVANLPKANWSWRRRGEELSNEEALERLLQEHGIDTNDYPPGATAELCDELYESRYATLNIRAGHLVRNIQIIKVWLCATILSVDYVLRSKGKMQFGKRERNHKEGPVTMRMRSDQDWKAAALACLYGKLGMDEAFVKSHLVIVDSSYRLDEEVEYSRSYPGLKTVYNIHTVKCRVKDVDNPEMSFIGLPEGNDFAVTRVRQSLRPSKTGREGVVSTLWFWKPRNQLTETGDLLYFQKSFTNDQHKDHDTEDCTPVAKRQLDLPMVLEVTVSDEDGDEYRLVVAELMKGRTTNWSRARRAAKRMLDPTYGLKSFYDDCLASFPELLLYGADDGGLVSSGRSSMEEYQRTMGALFAVFWFMRRKMGGAESFCFGVDDEWEPLNARSKQPRRKKEEIAKRQTFFNEVEWERIDELLHDAGLLCDGVEGHDEERVLAMLVLTAIHDIMKLVPLLPTVAPDHAPYRGYKVGETIHDHDIALSYVLDHYSYALPSYHELSKKQQDSIRFTQCKMEYNMGWLVQAEGMGEGAAPAAICKDSVIRLSVLSQFLPERPPLPPPSLLDGFPDPQRVDARKQEYLKALQEQVRQRVATLTQRHQANLEYLRAKNDQCKRQARATIDQELLKQEMEVDRRHDEQLLALQQAAMRRKFNISKEAGELTLQYQTKATQEKLQHLDFELHRRYFDAAAKPTDWTQAQVAAASPPLLPPPPGGFSSPLSVAGLEPASPTSPARKTPGTLYVSIQAGHNLMNRDTGILGDVSDPYVVVKLGRQEFTTPVINNDLNPVWHVDNKFTLQVDKESLLELEVKNSTLCGTLGTRVKCKISFRSCRQEPCSYLQKWNSRFTLLYMHRQTHMHVRTLATRCRQICKNHLCAISIQVQQRCKQRGQSMYSEDSGCNCVEIIAAGTSG
ncbi:CAR11, partial [Symbiodinium sp. CCMP2456]